VMHDVDYVIIWPVGAAIGAWAAVPSQMSQALYIQNMALLVHGSWAAYRQHPFNMGWVAHTYKWARDTGTDLKDVMLTLFTIAIVGFPAAWVFMIWFMYHCGYVKLNYGWNNWVVDVALNQGVRGLTHFGSLLPPNFQFWQHGVMAVAGVVLVFLLYFLRARFVWFMVNPTALAMVLWLPELVWLASLVSLVAKYIGIRLVGARRFEEYVAYVAAGLLWGMGVPYIIAGVYELYLDVIPKFQAFYVP